MISEQILQTRLAVVGRIKIGGLGETRTSQKGKDYQPPVKYDHFVITGMDRDKSGNFIKDESIHAILGPDPKELRIRLLYNDIELNFRTELAHYQGKTCLCRGNGIEADELQKNELVRRQCPCPRLEAEGAAACKPHGVLTCLLDDAQICGGVYQFSTTGWNSIRGIMSALKFIAHTTGGKIAGLPLTLKYFKKTTTTREGKPTTVPVVTLVYQGNPVQLLEMAVENERKRLTAGIRMESVEADARREVTALLNAPILPEEDVSEMHPEDEEPPDFKGALNGAAGTTPPVEPETKTAETKPAKAETKTTNPETKPTVTNTKPAVTETKTETKKLRFFRCLNESCQHVATVNCGKLVACPKCTGAKLQEFPNLQAARDYKPETTTTETNPGAELSIEQIANEIAKLRGEKKLLQGPFVQIVKAVTGKVILDPAKMGPGQAAEVLKAVQEWSNGGGK